MDSVNLREVALFDSPSLFKEMAVLNKNAIAKTQTAMQFIHDNNIPGVIIGGLQWRITPMIGHLLRMWIS